MKMSKKLGDTKLQGKLTEAAFAVALVLLLAFSSFAVMPFASAHTPPWTIPTYAYIVVSPNPIGVGQQAFIIMWLDKPPPTAAGTGGDRWRDYTVEITKPDGTKQTIGPLNSDATSSTYSLFTPTMPGVYTFVFKFPGQVASLYGPTGIAGDRTSVFINDTYLPSSATTTVTVQQAPVTEPPTYPLPTEYWTRPIEGENTAWASIASNYINPNAAEHSALANRLQPDGIAPNSAHIMWTKPIQDGGVVGGSNTGVSGATYYTGLSYEGRFGYPIIMYGRLYYPLPKGNNAVGGGYVCVDLRTGEQIWLQNYTVNPSFAQLYWYDSFNQHGVIPNGILWAVSGTTWMAYDGLDGNWLFNLTDVPSGTNVYGPTGEIMRYVLNNNAHWLALWNNTAAPDETNQPGLTMGTTANAYMWRPVGKNCNASTAYSWNVTIPNLPAGSTIAKVIPDDMMLGYVSTMPTGQRWGTVDPFRFWAISLKPSTRGTLLWSKEYPAPAGNLTRLLYAVDPDTRVFLMNDKETMQWLGYSMDTGELLWGPVGETRDFNYYGTIGMGSAGQAGFAAYGKLYSGGYGGELFCYDIKTGNLVWKYDKTFSAHETPWGNYPISIGAIADGKVYAFTSEHSPNNPMYKGSRVRCIDANTGTELWTILSWAGIGSFGSEGFPIADGFVAYLNHYDAQVYCIGKGPSATTVSAPQTVIPKGTGVLLTGTVTDQSASAKELVKDSKFSAVAAMSDASMSAWMEYLYMQKPKPADATGVSVKLTAYDPNGNSHDIGTTTTDINGKYAITWTPPLEGTYYVIATFDSTNSYWGSQDTAYFAVGPAAAVAPQPSAAPTPTPVQTVSPTSIPTATSTVTAVPEPKGGSDTVIYVSIAAVVIIVAIAAAAVILRRRK